MGFGLGTSSKKKNQVSRFASNNTNVTMVINSVKGVEAAVEQGGFTPKAEAIGKIRIQYIDWLVTKKDVTYDQAKEIASNGIPYQFIEYVNSAKAVNF